jgi:hypothetical protein
MPVPVMTFDILVIKIFCLSFNRCHPIAMKPSEVKILIFDIPFPIVLVFLPVAS